MAGVVQDFQEKPPKESLAGGQWRRAGGGPQDEAAPFEASMGIYLFKREALERLLGETDGAAGSTPDVHFGYVRPCPAAPETS